MLKKLTYVALASAMAVPAAFAQDGGFEEQQGTTERQIEEVDEGVFSSPFVFTPQAGVLGYQNQAGDYDIRGLTGITATWNAAGMMDVAGIQAGLETGVLYSHLGNPDSNLFGTGSDVSTGDAGANAFLIPAAIVGGVDVGGIHVTGRLGADMLYRSDSNSMQIGRDDAGNDDSFDVLPMVGLGAGFDASQNVAISLRGSYIPVPADDLFTATLGATIGLG